jgi:hypothetical protein
VQVHAQRGSLAHIDVLEQTGIVVEPSAHVPQRAPSHYPIDPEDSGPVMPGPGYLPPGALAMGGVPYPGAPTPWQVKWAALAPAERPWLLLVIILLLGVGTAAVIGLSGPTIEAGLAPQPLPSAPAADTTR